MKFAYARVSTLKQFSDGNSLDEQIAKLKLVGYDALFIEEFTGSMNKLPCFDALIQRLRKGDTLIVTKLDRFARSTAEVSSIINGLLNRGVAVHILDMGLIDDTPIGRLINNIMLVLAEYERSMIIERTQVEENARSKRKRHGGRIPIAQAKKDLAVDLILNQHKSYNEAVELTGISIATIARALRSARAKLRFAGTSLGDSP